MLELDHTGYVVCQKPSSYVFEDFGGLVVVVVFDMDMILGVQDVEVAAMDVTTAEVNPVAAVGMIVTVYCPAAVTVTVATAGGNVVTEVSVVPCPVTVIVLVPIGTVSVDTTISVV